MLVNQNEKLANWPAGLLCAGATIGGGAAVPQSCVPYPEGTPDWYTIFVSWCSAVPLRKHRVNVGAMFGEYAGRRGYRPLHNRSDIALES
jgi:hypothetical protein